MLTDTRLRHLKPKEKLYKVNDRDGLYAAVTPAGTMDWRKLWEFSEGCRGYYLRFASTYG